MSEIEPAAVSVGGKVFWLEANGDDVHLKWFDQPMSHHGDALLDPDAAITLGEALIEQGKKVLDNPIQDALNTSLDLRG